MSELKCIIVEDEPLAVKVLADYIAQVPFLHLEGTFKDAILATEYLRERTTGLIFLDIHLPKLKGLAFLKTLRQPPAVIITTAYHQYAIEGFELAVTDYLLKPFSFERFLVAVNKIRTVQTAVLPEAVSHPEKEYLFLNVQKKKVKILFSDIVYIESQREYVRVVTTKQEYTVKMGTQEIEALLPTNLFKRIHRSYIVSLNKVDSFSAEEVELNGVTIPIGRAYKDCLANF